ncbi:ABC transporter ATP-binding protein [Clostridium sp. Marseille-P299]|uniref:ABC transporter ATP-binding protein n=1 Tax=Clostridium sp. Marseille-P299 TaxID=1805477 RepID=UPI000831E279|nr:ABC transporter ATP-binding protein [Clostridium sp. Marseille-P299]
MSKEMQRESTEEDSSLNEDLYINCYGKNKKRPIKILMGLYKGHYSKFILSGIFFALKHSCVWVLPIVTANIINIALAREESGLGKIIFNLIVILALVTLNIPMNYLYTKCRSRAVRDVEAGLRGAMVRKLQQLSMSYHKEMQSGRLQSKIMRDVEAIETLSQQLFINTLTIGLNIIVALSVTLFKSRIVFLFFLVSAPIAAFTIVGFKSKIKKSNSEFRKEMEETSARVMEMVELIPVTRAHALEKEEIKKMESQLNLVAEKGYRLDIIQANFGAVSWAVFQAFQIICLGFSGFLAYKGKISVGDITLYQTYFTTVVNQVSNFINLLPIISKGMESVNSVGEVILADDIENNKGKKKIKKVNGEYEFKDVSFSYDNKKTVLNSFNLKVNEGETIAFVGESGAGKSTVLNLVIGFIKPNKGKILLDGNDLNQINLRSYRKHLAVVPQTSILFSGTIRDNITYGMTSVTDEKIIEVIKAANLTEFIESLPQGLDTIVGEHGGKLSGGQRQRISIARALIRDPRVIVLDEATSALDSISEREIQKALNNLTKNRTTFIVAHRLSTIRNADRIAVINGGRCVEYGTYEELMALKGEFYEMRRLQIE